MLQSCQVNTLHCIFKWILWVVIGISKHVPSFTDAVIHPGDGFSTNSSALKPYLMPAIKGCTQYSLLLKPNKFFFFFSLSNPGEIFISLFHLTKTVRQERYLDWMPAFFFFNCRGSPLKWVKITSNLHWYLMDLSFRWTFFSYLWLTLQLMSSCRAGSFCSIVKKSKLWQIRWLFPLKAESLGEFCIYMF